MRQIQATLAALNGSYHLQEPPNRSDSNRVFSFQDVPHENFPMFLRHPFFHYFIPFYQFSGLRVYLLYATMELQDLRSGVGWDKFLQA